MKHCLAALIACLVGSTGIAQEAVLLVPETIASEELFIVRGSHAAPGTAYVLWMGPADDPGSRHTFSVGVTDGLGRFAANGRAPRIESRLDVSFQAVLFGPDGIASSRTVATRVETRSLGSAPLPGPITTTATALGPLSGTRDATELVSYANDLQPIWTVRGCNMCHPNAGGFDLSGPPSSTYLEVIERVDLMTPTNSLVLLKPLDPGAGGVNHGGGGIFMDTSDPDYQTILSWIEQGAWNN